MIHNNWQRNKKLKNANSGYRQKIRRREGELNEKGVETDKNPDTKNRTAFGGFFLKRNKEQHPHQHSLQHSEFPSTLPSTLPSQFLGCPVQVSRVATLVWVLPEDCCKKDPCNFKTEMFVSKVGSPNMSNSWSTSSQPDFLHTLGRKRTVRNRPSKILYTELLKS